jgi:hypothetical protein
LYFFLLKFSTNGQETVDLHPEKRLRAAYLEYEEENLERLKKENPNMRLSQIKQLLWKVKLKIIFFLN